MHCKHWLIGGLMAVLATGGMLPTVAMAASPVVATPSAPPKASPVVDIRQHQGLVYGQVLTPQGTPAAEVAVQVRHQGRDLVALKTDAQGRFAIQGMRGGVYEMTSQGGGGAFRVWSTGTEPPAAQPAALLVTGEDAVRAQDDCCRRPILDALHNPWVLGGATAAIVATAIALDDNDASTP